MESSKKNVGKLPTYTVKSNGKTISNLFRIKQIKVNHEINRIGTAELQILAGDMPGKNIPESASDEFKPGAEIIIYLGYESNNNEVFRGIIISHRVRVPKDLKSPTLLIVECKNNAIKATIARKNRIFTNLKDNEIISNIFTESGLKVNVDSTEIRHNQLVQYYCTDWDFVLSRADACGLLISTAGETIKISVPDVAAKESLTVTYGDDMISFDAELLAEEQFAKVESVGWNPAMQKVIIG